MPAEANDPLGFINYIYGSIFRRSRHPPETARAGTDSGR
jgi:hypothetical protein